MTNQHSDPDRSPDRRNLIVLLIDGLNPVFLSPHGCSWIDTPAFDQLAAESVVFERAVTETVDAGDACWSFLTGLHPARRSTSGATSEAATEATEKEIFADLANLSARGTSTILMTDSPNDFPGGDRFETVIQLPTQDGKLPERAAKEVSETFMASCFAKILDELPKQASPFVCVIHLSSLVKVWDAPASQREKFRDEEDPEALTSIEPPQGQGDFDPDQILGVTHAYAAELETLDTCLDVFMHELKADGLLDHSMLMLCGLRGFPVGNLKQMGHAQSHLNSDATSVPLFIRAADKDANRLAATRTCQLTRLSEWFPFACEWVSGVSGVSGEWVSGGLAEEGPHRLHVTMQGIENGTSTVPVRSVNESDDQAPADHTEQFVVVTSTDSRAIWTPSWLLTETRYETEPQVRLYVKPDDRWDFNPVQDRCRWIAEELLSVLEIASGQLRRNQPVSVESLADELVFGIE